MSEWLIKLAKEKFEKSKLAEERDRFAGDEEANALLTDVVGTPHAFVLGCLMDRQIPAKKAWVIPHKIRQWRGSFSIKALKEISDEEMQNFFTEKSLHRFNDIMADIFCRGVRSIDKKYGGDASRIWSDKPGSAAVVYRFLEFRGVGQKISTMAANILVRRFDVKMSDYYSIDISVDTHIRRVMKRMGLVPEDAKDEMLIWKAREMNPEFPGIFDHACWRIGRDFCHPKTPDCGGCPARSHCPKKSV